MQLSLIRACNILLLLDILFVCLCTYFINKKNHLIKKYIYIASDFCFIQILNIVAKIYIKYRIKKQQISHIVDSRQEPLQAISRTNG